MQRCPVCNARWNGSRNCHRCKSDIGKLADIETASDDFYHQAIAAYQSSDYPAMLNYATRACSLRRTPKTIRMAACAALLSGQFDAALNLRGKFVSSKQENHI
jgi:hypothetical protein